ncbi:hypothetical protein J2Z69_003338 [Paenibacillus shirakamiensis]|uniref:Cytoplasmic protein n=1 Tax=Paenibacillus shirakamiensis TaxID=1265935 RepID=A0ABS4JKM2_9BACL|nr:TerD family protein [Paenibacillus shirakamiensis]MBP2002266.1 hypothetical protein [Paenibacillus shirakamiensis]
MTNNSIYVRRANKLIVDENKGFAAQLPQSHVATAMKNIEYLGYTFSYPLMQALRSLTVEQFESLYDQLIDDLRVMVGAHVAYCPMYPNFPDQVMQMHDADLYLNEIYHYITLDMQAYEVKDRPVFVDNIQLKVIDLGSNAEFYTMIRQLIQSKGSISDTDKKDIDLAIASANPEDIVEILPLEIPFKENVGFVAAALLKHDKASLEMVGRYMRTATDVLRLAVAWSDGDVSLSQATRFRKFKRSERRWLLGLLERCHPMTEDMLKYRDRWVRLGEVLHPSEYKHKFTNCKVAFDVLRNKKPFSTFNGSVELAFRYRQFEVLLDLLKERPGEFARRLDQLLRSTEPTKDVVQAFGEVADQVSTPVLLQVISHFNHRHAPPELRVFFPKGNVAKAFAIPNILPKIEIEICQAVVQACERVLVERFAKLPSLGKVYLDERLMEYNVPFSQRSASKALHTIVRGSQVELREGNTVRFFSWWKEGMVQGVSTDRVDIDLSAVIYDAEWNYVEHISYTNLRSSKYQAIHSGDIVTAPEGACEFIDLHIPSTVHYGGRYVVATLHSFTNQPYCNLPECFMGWSMRKEPGSGELFEPLAVANKIDVTADTQIAIPMILDLVQRKVIWTDLALSRNPHDYNNVEGNQKGMILMGKALTDLRKPNLYDLFKLHAEARGVGGLVTADQADTVFSLDNGITPYNMELIMAEYIG